MMQKIFWKPSSKGAVFNEPFHWHDMLCFVLCLTGLQWFLREVYARRKVTIVNYHNPSRAVFESHMKSFSRYYSFVSMDQVIAALDKKKFNALPRKPLLITLDDGHAGNARLFPILHKYKVPAVIYVVAGLVNTKRGFWFKKLPHTYAAMKKLKEMPDSERRTILRSTYGHEDNREYEEAAALSAAQLKEFIAIGGTVGSHTVFHPLLSRCEDQVGRGECEKSRSILEAMTGEPVRDFALPNGDFDNRTQSWLKEAGYRTCRTIAPGWVTVNSDPMELPNFGVSDNASVSKAMVQASGLWSILKGLKS